MSGYLTRRVFLSDLGRLGSAASLGLLAGCATAPAPAAPGPARVYRVGLLAPAGPAEGSATETFWGRLAELGYVEGENLLAEERIARGPGPIRFDEFAEGLVRLPVDAIVAMGAPAVRSAMASTTLLPIVMVRALDPVGAGLVESLARPGRNVTGVAGEPLEVDEKRLQLLLEAVPTISRVAIGVDPVIGLAEQYRLPAIHPTRNFAERGGLMAYEPRLSEMYRRAAEFVDRILRGASPADFPIELPTRYDLVANMRTARSLGLTLSRDFLARVDELIE